MAVLSILSDPMGYSPPDSAVHVILHSRILPFPSPGDLPDLGIKPQSPPLQADSLLIELQGTQSCLMARF